MSRYRHIHNLNFVVHEMVKNFDSGAVINSQGEVLGLKYESVADIGTLGASAMTAIKYFPLKSGDLVVLNDPYSGGTTLSTLSLVTPLQTEGPTGALYLVIRTTFRPQLTLSKAVEEEGLRIPPTPLAHNRHLNEAVLKAIATHPLCPPGFDSRMRVQTQELWNKVDQFRQIVQFNPTLFSKPNVKKYFEQTDKALSQCFFDWSHGDSKIEVPLDGGEVIRLRTYFDADQILFDFSGSSPSQRICLTDSATFGACVGATLALLKTSLPLNSGLFSHFQVVTPLGSLLNAKYPSPTFKGMTEGTTLVAAAVLQGLGKVIAPDQISMSSQTPVLINLVFGSTGQKFFDSLPGGVGATESKAGSDALHLWTKNKLKNSVQEIESLFPLRIKKIGIRAQSGGKGLFKGGNGLFKEYELLDSAELTWSMEQRKYPPKGIKGASSGLPPEIIIVKSEPSGGKEKEKLILEESEGKIQLRSGDRILVSTAGGGAYGASPQ